MRKPTDIGTPRAKKNNERSLGKLTPAEACALREAEQRPCRWCDLPEGAPTRCHRCPKLDGDIMPHCWGCIHGNSLATCCCPRVKLPTVTRLETEVRDLRRTVAALTEALHEAQNAKKRPPG